MAAYMASSPPRRKKPSPKTSPPRRRRKTTGSGMAGAATRAAIQASGVGKKPPPSRRQKRDADLAQRSRASYKKAKSGGAFTRVAQGKAAPRRGTSPVSAGRGLGASGVKQARRSAMASSAAARKQLHKTSRTLSRTARSRDMAEASPARKKEMQASQQKYRKEAASWARRKPPAGARKKASPSQSAQMAERRKYGRAAAGFAAKRLGAKRVPQSPAGAKRRASLAKSVGRGVRGPGRGGRR